MGEKHVLVENGTVYCSQSVANNSPGTAVPFKVTSQQLVTANGGKLVATEKDETAANMNFGLCNDPKYRTPPPCRARVTWFNTHRGVQVGDQELSLLTEESEGVCTACPLPGTIKVAWHGQQATVVAGDMAEADTGIMAILNPLANPAALDDDIPDITITPVQTGTAPATRISPGQTDRKGKGKDKGVDKMKIKRRPDDTEEFKVENGKRVKMYLEAADVPPDKKIKSFWWRLNYKSKKTEMCSVVVEMPNAFCGYEVPVKLICPLTDKMRSNLFSPVEGDAAGGSCFLYDFIWAKRVFKPYCDMLFNRAELCYPDGYGKITMDKEGFYHVRRHEEIVILFDVEGLNGKTVPFVLIPLNGREDYKSSAIVKKNTLAIPYSLCYDDFGGDILEDAFTICLYPIDGKKQTFHSFRFKLKVHDKKIFTGEEILEYKQVLVVGAQIQIAENNFHPCKYTDLELRAKEKNKCVFSRAADEFLDFFEQAFAVDWRVLEDAEYEQAVVYTEAGGNHAKPFALVCGGEEKDMVVLAKDFETEKCSRKTDPHKQVVTLQSNGPDTESPPSTKKLVMKKTGTWEGQIPVRYHYEGNDGIGLFAPLDYFLPFLKQQTAVLKVASCRRTLEIPVHIYPDIQWALAVHFAVGENTKAGNFMKIFSFKNLREGKWPKNTFEASLSASWDNAYGRPGKKYSIYVNLNDLKKSGENKGNGRDVLGGFLQNQFYLSILSLYESIIEVFSFLDLFNQVMYAVENLELRYGRQIPLPKDRKKWEFSITPPKVDLAFSWRAGAYNGDGGIVVEGSANGKIIGLQAKFDMFALAGKMPQLRAAVVALEIIEYVFDIDFRFDLVISGVVDLEGKIGYDLPRGKSASSLQAKGSLDFELKLEAEVTATENHRLVTKTYGVKGVASVDFIYSIVPEDDGLYSPFSARFKGLTGSIYCKITVANKINGKASDDRDAGPFSDESERIIATATFIKEIPIFPREEKNNKETPKVKIL